MGKLDLRVSEVVQGSFEISDLNLLLVFQVNCPGCFIYALPVAIRLHEDYSHEGLNILGLSTAFEDFQLNTLGNTIKLTREGYVVGETRKILQKAGYDRFPVSIPFDIAFDYLERREGEIDEEDIKRFLSSFPEFEQAPPNQKDAIKDQVRNYLLHKEWHAHTFDRNHLKGTPSWIVFDKDFEICYESFGHKEYEYLEKIILRFLKPKAD